MNFCYFLYSSQLSSSIYGYESLGLVAHFQCSFQACGLVYLLWRPILLKGLYYMAYMAYMVLIHV